MKKGLSIAISIFVFVFMISIVYAASIGQLKFGGSSTFASNIDLKIIDAGFSSSTPANNINAVKQDESIEVPSVLGYKTMYITVDLMYPEDKRIIEFSIQNIGNVSSTLDSLQIIDTPDIATSGVKITWPDLENITILPGQTSGPYQIEIEWDIDYYYVTAGQHTFSASVAYSQTTTP